MLFPSNQSSECVLNNFFPYLSFLFYNGLSLRDNSYVQTTTIIELQMIVCRNYPK